MHRFCSFMAEWMVGGGIARRWRGDGGESAEWMAGRWGEMVE